MSVIYLTGAPATGKSTLSRTLKANYPNLVVFAYSEKLRELIGSRLGATSVDENEIRAKSAQIVTPDDILELDQSLIGLVESKRATNTILIDSHPVTKEDYGFRVTGFSVAQLQALNPDVIVCLYASNETIIQRIKNNPMGRPQVSEFEAQTHTVMQAQVAVQYGIVLGKPVYLIDASQSAADVARVVASKARLS